MNPHIARLHPYPFQKLARLIQSVTPAVSPGIVLSIGEPKHAPPPLALSALRARLDETAIYPPTKGSIELRSAIAEWTNRRFNLKRTPLDPERHVLPACGTREALFSIAQAVIDNDVKFKPIVIMPNPFYQIYEGAALLANAEPYYLNVDADSHYQMNFNKVPEDIWRRTQLVYVCSPGNPTGAVVDRETYIQLIERAQHYGFIIAADECYSEIYFDESTPPLGLLEIADELGIEDYRHCVAFHSLSKRSNLPGLRSGFMAGDGKLMQQLLQYRTYHGCAMSSLAQHASIAAWSDEDHVRANRTLYREKFDRVLSILRPVMRVDCPQAGFYLWPETPLDDETFARELYVHQNILVLPGRYLSRSVNGMDPGCNRIRVALVAGLSECLEAANRIYQFLGSINRSSHNINN